jgi:hypothetical protein
MAAQNQVGESRPTVPCLHGDESEAEEMAGAKGNLEGMVVAATARRVVESDEKGCGRRSMIGDGEAEKGGRLGAARNARWPR